MIDWVDDLLKAWGACQRGDSPERALSYPSQIPTAEMSGKPPTRTAEEQERADRLSRAAWRAYCRTGEDGRRERVRHMLPRTQPTQNGGRNTHSEPWPVSVSIVDRMLAGMDLNVQKSVHQRYAMRADDIQAAEKLRISVDKHRRQVNRAHDYILGFYAAMTLDVA
jgi:hypothetical protein